MRKSFSDNRPGAAASPHPTPYSSIQLRTKAEIIRALAVSVLALGGVVFTGCVEIPQEKLSLAIEKEELSDHVHFLAQPGLKGRNPRSLGSREARRYIQSRFETYGLKPWGESRGYSQPFGFGTNVVGVLPGSDEELADQIVLVSAHYDHVGADKRGKTYPGAGDNASGVAALLEIAEKLSLSKHKPRRSVCFAAFDCEERFLLGAFAFTCREDFDRQKLAAAINIDLLGRDFFDVVDNALFVIGTEAYPDLRKEILNAGSHAKVRVFPIGTDLAGPSSDHVVFEPFQVPCLFFSCGPYSDHHKATDSPDRLDYSKMQRETDVIFQAVRELANSDEIGPPTLPAEGDPEELHAIRTVLTEVGARWEETGLTDRQREKAKQMLRRAEQLGEQEDYGSADRRKLVWDLQSLIDAQTHLGSEGKRDERALSGTDWRRMIIRSMFLDYRGPTIEGIRECMRRSLRKPPNLFSGPIRFSSTTCQPSEKIWFEPTGDDQYFLATVIARFEVSITVEASLLPPFKKGAFQYGIGFLPLGFVGARAEAVDYLLLSWDPRVDPTQALPEILEVVTSEHDKKSYEDWLQYRLRQLDGKDEKQWVIDLLGSINGQLVRTAIYPAFRIAPQEFLRKMPELAANPHLPPDVRATVIRLVPEPFDKKKLRRMRPDVRAEASRAGMNQPTRKTLLWLIELLGEEVVWEPWDIQHLLDPSHPLHDSPSMSILRELTKKMSEKQRTPPRTLADEAEDKLKKLTGQDFGKDRDAWKEWVEAHFPQE